MIPLSALFVFLLESVILFEAFVCIIDEDHFPDDILKLLLFGQCGLFVSFGLVVGELDDVGPDHLGVFPNEADQLLLLGGLEVVDEKLVVCCEYFG